MSKLVPITLESLRAQLQQRCALQIISAPQGLVTAGKTDTTANLSLARQIVSKSLAPADPKAITFALTTMRALVTRRAEAEEDIALSLTAFTQKLLGYPGDAVLAVLAAWPDNHEFWPAWKELRDQLEIKTAWRRALLADIERMIQWEQTPQIEPTPREDRPEVSEQDRIDILAMRDAFRERNRQFVKARSMTAPAVPPRRSPEEQMRALRDEGAA